MRKFEINEPVKLSKRDVVGVSFVLDVKRFLFITLYAVQYYKRLYNYSNNEECIRWMTSFHMVKYKDLYFDGLKKTMNEDSDKDEE